MKTMVPLAILAASSMLVGDTAGTLVPKDPCFRSATVRRDEPDGIKLPGLVGTVSSSLALPAVSGSRLGRVCASSYSEEIMSTKPVRTKTERTKKQRTALRQASLSLAQEIDRVKLPAPVVRTMTKVLGTIFATLPDRKVMPGVPGVLCSVPDKVAGLNLLLCMLDIWEVSRIQGAVVDAIADGRLKGKPDRSLVLLDAPALSADGRGPLLQKMIGHLARLSMVRLEALEFYVGDAVNAQNGGPCGPRDEDGDDDDDSGYDGWLEPPKPSHV